MNCINCGKELSEDAKFCPGCGTAIQGLLEEKNCDACGAKVLYTDSFCSSCGKKLSEEGKSDFEEYEDSNNKKEEIVYKEQSISSEVNGKKRVLDDKEKKENTVAGFVVCAIMALCLLFFVFISTNTADSILDIFAPPCVNECGNKADANCAVGMCDDCCDDWYHLNGCFVEH